MRIHTRARLAGAVLLFLASVTTSVQAQHHRDEWEYLGNAHVDGNYDHDNIKVGVQDGRFHAIQLRVRGGAIEFQRVLIHYADGEPEDIVVRERIPEGGNSRSIELRGYERYIKSLELWYSRGDWHTRPEVQLFGRR